MTDNTNTASKKPTHVGCTSRKGKDGKLHGIPIASGWFDESTKRMRVRFEAHPVDEYMTLFLVGDKAE